MADVGEHGRPPRIGGTFGAQAVQVFMASTEPGTAPVIPTALELLDAGRGST